VPNKQSAAKRQRQNVKRRAHNKAQRSTMRSAIKHARVAAQQGAENSDALIKEAHARVGKAAKVGLIKDNNASRRISRLMRAVNRAKAAQASQPET
jgi:small subunit ribosomal protein S20